MNLQPSEFIAKTGDNLQGVVAYNLGPGTVVRLRGHVFVLVDAPRGPRRWVAAQTGYCLSHEQFAAWMRGDATDLPVILFDPLDTNTSTENNND